MLKSHKTNLVPEQDFHKKSSTEGENKFAQVQSCVTYTYTLAIFQLKQV